MADENIIVTATSDRPFISESLSVYLDLVRFLAALAVLVGHMDQDGLYASWLMIGSFSHAAVVVFFVLSGLVISQSAFTRERDWSSYAVARFARIYSVVIPAIVLSFAVKGLAVWLDPALSNEFFQDNLRARNVLGAVFFLNESWGMHTRLPWNNPFWSLCYEVWYYAIFGLALFATGRYRWLWILLACVVAGPAILLLFPLWLLGSWLARNGHRLVPSRSVSLAVWLATMIAFVCFNLSGVDTAIKTFMHEHIPGYWRFEASQFFVTDYLMGLLVALNFAAFRGLGEHATKAMAWLKGPVVYLAGFTFSLYLYHRPMTQFVGHFFPNREHNVAASVLYLAVIVGICLLLGAITEKRKHVFRKLGYRILGGIAAQKA